MDVKTIYQYTRPDGGTTVSPICPDGECQTLYRIVAGEGLGVRKDDGDLLCSIDVEDVNGWVEEVLPPTPVIEPSIEEVEEEPDSPDEEIPLEEPPTPEVPTPVEPLPQSFVLSQEEYLEWKDYKGRVSTLEYQLELIINSLKAKEELT